MATGPDINHGSRGLACDWTLVVVSCIVVLLRFYSKGIIIKRLGWDDILMGISLMTAFVHAIVMTKAYQYGWGRHAFYLSDQDRINATKWIFISQFLGVIAPMFGRLAFCIYMYYIVGQSSRWQRWSLYVVSALQVVINVVSAIMILTQCGTHVGALWGSTKAKCWSPTVQTDTGYFQSAFNSLSDLYLTILPAFIIWKLQIRLEMKAGLSILLCLSIFAFAASVVKTYEIHILNQRGDITWNFVGFVVWAALEINIVIIVASIPTLRPFFQRHSVQPTCADHELRGRTSGNNGESGDSSGYGCSGSHEARLAPRGSKANGASTLCTTSSEEDILWTEGRIQRTYNVKVASYVPREEHEFTRSEEGGQGCGGEYKW